MVFPNIDYVTADGVAFLKANYKYTGTDRSILAKLMQPWWNTAVNWIPQTMAPNMVTLIGFFFVIASYLVSAFYCPTLSEAAPIWVYFFHAFCLFVYQTLDALDGKHARKTGSSSPLGELFDHGCDAVSTTLAMLITLSTLRLGSGFFPFSLVLISNLVFWMAQWEQFTVGNLDLGLINVTEAQFGGMLIHIVTGVLGPQFWLNKVELAGFSLQYNHFLPILQILIITGTVLNNIVNILKAVSKKKLSLFKTLTQAIPVTLTLLFSCVWIYRTNVADTSIHTLSLSFGLLMAILAGRTVLARVCGEPFRALQPVVFPLGLGALNSFHHFTSNHLLSQILSAFYVLAYLHLAFTIIEVLCEALKINCLSIPAKKTA